MTSSKKKTNRSEVKLWGEISEETRTVISDEKLRTLIPGAVRQEEPRKLPATEEEDDNFILPEHLTKPNEYIVHTIKLHEHAKAVQALIDSVTPGKTEFDPCPPIPDMEIPPRLPKEIDPKEGKAKFELGQGPEFPVLDTETIDLIIQKSVLVTLAETGFDKAKRSAIIVLVDVVRDILTKICRMLHIFSQQDLMRDRTIYRDPLEKVMQLLGLSGVRELQDFYLKNVIGKRDLAVKRSKSLVNQYNKVINKVKDQAALEQDEASVPEVSFSSMNLNDNVIQNSIQPGFKMLQDLESEVHLTEGIMESTSHNIPSSTKEYILNGSSIIKKRIGGSGVQAKRKKVKME